MAQKQTCYDERFYDYTSGKSAHAADRIVGRLIELFQPSRVCDVGCGEGVWLAAYARRGLQTLCGLDGDYVDRARLRIDETCFVPCDLAQPFQLDGRFDLLQSFEVAEHLPLAQAQPFVEALVKASDVVAFSASVPGQGGLHHINEQPLAFWRDLFRAHGFAAYDPIRPYIANDTRIPPWYRHNVLVYVSDTAPLALRDSLAAYRLADDAPIPEFAPLWYRLRCRFIKSLPFSLQQFLAKLVS